MLHRDMSAPGDHHNVAVGASAHDAPKHVLLVEGNDMNRDMLGRRLTKRGYRVRFAIDGWDAIRTAIEEQPDLILMDLSLPKLDGWEATRRLKAQRLTADIPIIALTANALTQDRDTARSAGCDGFETKPINFTNLLVKITNLLS